MRRPLFGALAAAVALILALTGCAAAPAASSESAGGTVSVTHARGTLDAPANPANATFELKQVSPGELTPHDG